MLYYKKYIHEGYYTIVSVLPKLMFFLALQKTGKLQVTYFSSSRLHYERALLARSCCMALLQDIFAVT